MTSPTPHNPKHKFTVISEETDDDGNIWEIFRQGPVTPFGGIDVERTLAAMKDPTSIHHQEKGS